MSVTQVLPERKQTDLLCLWFASICCDQGQSQSEAGCWGKLLSLWRPVCMGILGSAPPNRSARKQTILRLNNISNISARQLMEQEVSPNKQQYFNNKIKKPATTDIFERLYRKISPKSRIISGLGNWIRDVSRSSSCNLWWAWFDNSNRIILQSTALLRTNHNARCNSRSQSRRTHAHRAGPSEFRYGSQSRSCSLLLYRSCLSTIKKVQIHRIWS